MSWAEEQLRELRSLPHDTARERLEYRLMQDERRGGDHAAQVPVLRRWLTEHRPSSSEKGTACTKCGDAWPCGQLAGILALD